jgi:hypothetical protein
MLSCDLSQPHRYAVGWRCRAPERSCPHPNECALIYGLPVPGYVAPATRVTSLLLRIIVDAAPEGLVPPANAETADAQAAGTALSAIRSCLPPGIPEALIQRRLMVWTGL